MILKGYIKPYNNFTFTIPIYTDRENLYFHELDDDLIINNFIKVNINDIPVYSIESEIEVNINDYGIIVFIGDEGIPILNFANLIVEDIFKLYKDEVYNRVYLKREIDEIQKKTVLAKIQMGDVYTLEKAALYVKETVNSKLDASINIDVLLRVDPRKTKQIIRGVSLSEAARVIASLAPDNVLITKGVVVDYTDQYKFVEKFIEGRNEFDVIITMLPSKTVKMYDFKTIQKHNSGRGRAIKITKAISKAKAKKMRLNFTTDEFGIVHTSLGKASFSAEKISDNAIEFINVINNLKPVDAIGAYIKSIYLSCTPLDTAESVKNDVFNKKIFNK